MPGIISGGAWLSNRRRFLEEELAKDPPPSAEQREALETELTAVKEQLAVGRGRRLGWLLWGGRPPG